MRFGLVVRFEIFARFVFLVCCVFLVGFVDFECFLLDAAGFADALVRGWSWADRAVVRLRDTAVAAAARAWVAAASCTVVDSRVWVAVAAVSGREVVARVGSVVGRLVIGFAASGGGVDALPTRPTAGRCVTPVAEATPAVTESPTTVSAAGVATRLVIGPGGVFARCRPRYLLIRCTPADVRRRVRTTRWRER